jgi:hypothetical protein
MPIRQEERDRGSDSAFIRPLPAGDLGGLSRRCQQMRTIPNTAALSQIEATVRRPAAAHALSAPAP